MRKFVDDVIIASRKEDLAEMGEDQDGGKNSTVFLDAIMPYLDGTKK